MVSIQQARPGLLRSWGAMAPALLALAGLGCALAVQAQPPARQDLAETDTETATSTSAITDAAASAELPAAPDDGRPPSLKSAAASPGRSLGQRLLLQLGQWRAPITTATQAVPNERQASWARLSGGLQVIELRPEGVPLGPPPKRHHHALSMSTEAPKRLLRGLGLDATDCATRFRMPSKLQRGRDGSVNVELGAQLGMACRF